jgi:soluble lytic murein transglycosylase-like protein
MTRPGSTERKQVPAGIRDLLLVPLALSVVVLHGLRLGAPLQRAAGRSRPRLERGQHGWSRPSPATRTTAPAPVAVLALATLGMHWCREERQRTILVALAVVALVVQGSLVAPRPEGPWSRLPALPSLPLPWAAPARPVPESAMRAVPQAPAPLEAAPPAAVPDASAVPADPVGRAPWVPPDAALRPYPARVEGWRPLVRELLAEAWVEGRLDGPAAAIDDDFVLAVIEQESAGDEAARSWAGAIGLMQVMPFTFAEMLAGDRALVCALDPAAVWDAPSNVRAGIRYLALAMRAFDGDRYWALAAYNAGIETAGEWRANGLAAIPPVAGYTETAAYAPAVLRSYLGRRPDVAAPVPAGLPPPQLAVALRVVRDQIARRPSEVAPRCGR